MNVQNLKEPPKNSFDSPLLFDNHSNGNEEQSVNCSECEWNMNSDSAWSTDQPGGDYIPQGADGLEHENTIDYLYKQTDSISKVITANPFCPIELQDTVESSVDYVHKQVESSFPPRAPISSHHEVLSNPSHFQYMHNLQNVEQPMPYLKQSSDAYSKPEQVRTIPCTVNKAHDACGNLETGQLEEGSPISKHKAETTQRLFSSLFETSSEMRMRKNSVISSGTEKPMSTSLLESSALPNTSTEVFSPSLKWTNKAQDCCTPVEQSTKDLNYFEVPPHVPKDPKRVLNNNGPDVGNEVSDIYRVVVTCSTPKEGVEQGLQNLSDSKKTVKMKDMNRNSEEFLPATTQEAIVQVFHAKDNDNVAKDINCVLAQDTSSKSSSRTRSCSLEFKDLNEVNCDDTFLVASSQADAMAYTSTPLPESKNMTFCVPALDNLGSIEKVHNADVAKEPMKVNCVETKAGQVKGIVKQEGRKLTTVKSKKSELVSFPKPNFRNVKAKVLSRPALLGRDCPTPASKSSPRSPQSTSNASSPVASPRVVPSSVRVVKKKSALDQDPKAEAAIAKLHKQAINKQLFPSQLAHAPTHTKYASGKVPRTAVLKQTQDDSERASSSNSTRSSSSAAALTCTAGSKVTENKGDKPKTSSKPAAVNGVHMGPDMINQNGIAHAVYEKPEPKKEAFASADIFVSIEVSVVLLICQ